MTIAEHLDELRSRVIRCLFYLVGAFVLCLIFNDHVMGAIIRQPIRVLMDLGYEKPQMSLFRPTEGFITWLKLALVCALIVASPLMARELWRFISAGLYPHERKWIEIFGPMSYLLFLGGVAFLSFLVMPTALKFLLNFGMLDKLPGLDTGGPVMQQVPQLAPYISLYVTMSLLMGLVFQLPLFMSFFMATGILKPAFFRKYRRHFIVGAVIVLAVVSPTGDAPTLILISLPVILLFEGGIILGSMIGKGREK
jgi:sec-independent protein translocase protein TatC